MHLSHSQIHYWILAIAALLAFVLLAAPKPAHAQSSGFYTTTTNSTSSSSTTGGVTTTTSSSSTSTPTSTLGNQNWRNARNSGSDANWRDRAARDEDADPNHTSDLEARYPYDNTNGRNRSDVDAARSGFDDPRNPWDGRYTNDNPANYNSSNSGSNAVVNSLKGNEESLNRGGSRYSAGSYGTHAVHR